ncbi:MAG: DUF4175 family protein [Paracoccaceae bacterium]
MPNTDPLAPALRAIVLTRAGMAGERLAQALWVPASLLAAGATAWAFDLQSVLPRGVAFWGALGLGTAIIGTAAYGLWRMRWPTRADAVARLDATMPGRPLAALSDRQAINAQDPASAALWAAHRARMQAVAARARAVRPNADLARRDPYGLRLIALTGLVTAVMFGQPGGQGPVMPLSGPASAAIGASWEGWITPPAYTGRPGLYLNEIDREGFEVPQGSQVILRFYGPQGALSLSQTLGDAVQADETGAALEFTAMRSGDIAIDGAGGRRWSVTVLRDAPPEITPDGPMTRARGGAMELAFTARDDFGVRLAGAEITLDLAAVDRRHGLALDPEPREDLTLRCPCPWRAREEVSETLREDLSVHPWAQLPVRVTLSAVDAAGQEGRAQPVQGDLPGRRFFEPVARALVELRRDLLWNRQNAQRSAQIMRAMLFESDGAFHLDSAPVLIRGAINAIESRLADDSWTPEARDELASQLWDLALLLEEGELANARERLQRAQDRLDEAMRNGASPDEIAELMDELREATRDYMEMLAEQAEPGEQDGDQRDRGEESMTITQGQIQEMMDRIQQLMEEGRMDEAAELMAELNALLENLRMTRGEGGDPMPGDQNMEQMGETLDRQQQLSDETFQQLQEGFGKEGTPNAQDQQALDDLAERQRELAEDLRQQELSDVPGEGTPEANAGLDALEEAQRAMEEAADALSEGDARAAIERQAQALESMREGLRSLREARDADRAEATTEGSEQQGQREQGGRDPLGRNRGQATIGDETGTDVPGVDPRERARDLLDEIRRRSAELERPEDERDYLNRLIERF